MNTQDLKKGFLSGLVLAIVLGLLFLPVQTNASLVTWDFTQTITDDSVIGDPVGTDPWLRVTADDDGAGSVTFTLDFFGSNDDAEFLSALYLNLNPDYDPDELVFGDFDATSNPTVPEPEFDAGEDAFVVASNSFDIQLLFATKNKDRLIQPMTLSFTISGIGTLAGGLTAEDFNFLSDDSEDGYYAVAHVQGTDIEEDDGEGSAWIAVPASVPEPASLLLLGFGLIGLAVLKRRYSK